MSKEVLTKHQLRLQLSTTRRSIPKGHKRIAAQKIACLFAQSPWLKSSAKISCYWPNNLELDSRPLIQQILRANALCFLPYIHQQSKDLLFANYNNNSILQYNSLGFYQPIISQLDSVQQIQNMDLCLMPLVGFDSQGLRLGSGHGYFDKALSQNNRPLLIGLAYACQQVSKIPADHWDIPLDYCITEQEILSFSSTNN